MDNLHRRGDLRVRSREQAGNLLLGAAPLGDVIDQQQAGETEGAQRAGNAGENATELGEVERDGTAEGQVVLAHAASLRRRMWIR